MVAAGCTVFECATNNKIYSTGAVRCEEFVQKGNPGIPIGLKVKVDELKPGAYLLVMQAVDSAKNNALVIPVKATGPDKLCQYAKRKGRYAVPKPPHFLSLVISVD